MKRIKFTSDCNWLARAGDGVIKSYLSCLKLDNKKSFKYPTTFYLSNYYLSKVATYLYPELSKSINEHDLATIYEREVGRLYYYGSSEAANKFLQNSLFKYESIIYDQAIKDKKENLFHNIENNENTTRSSNNRQKTIG